MTSSGNEDKSKKAKSIVKYIIIGFVLVASSAAIFNLMIGKEYGGNVGEFTATEGQAP